MRYRPVRPGVGRISLTLLAVVPAALAFPWRSPTDHALLAIGIAVFVLLLGSWNGLHVTTIVGRRCALVRGRRTAVSSGDSGAVDATATAVLRINSAIASSFPLPLLVDYLDRYGIRADAIRITNRISASGVSQTWIGITISAAANLVALTARSADLPLNETTQVAARRLADHLRELGWEAALAGDDDLPELLTSVGRESWTAVERDDTDYCAAYRIDIADAQSALQAARSLPAVETWTALELSPGAGRGPEPGLTAAMACAVRVADMSALSSLTEEFVPERGNHWSALQALELVSGRRLSGPVTLNPETLAELSWPVAASTADHQQVLAG